MVNPEKMVHALINLHMLRSHMDDLRISDLVTVVSTETQLDTTTSFLKTIDMKKDIITQIFDVYNLAGVSFLTSTCGLVKGPESVKYEYRTLDLLYIMISCTVATTIDDRIHQEPISLYFCLKLPQSSSDISIGDITQIDTPSKHLFQAKYSTITPVNVGAYISFLFNIKY